MTVSEFVYLLVGTCLALCVQSFVQLVIVPRVDIRKRREDRWERHVQELGGVLTAELDERAEKARHSTLFLQSLCETIRRDPGKYPPDKVTSKLVHEKQNEASEHFRAYENLVTGRIQWLVQLLLSGSIKKNESLLELARTWALFRVDLADMARYVREDKEFDGDEFIKLWERGDERAAALRKWTISLARQRPPRGLGSSKRHLPWMRVKRKEGADRDSGAAS